MPNAYGVRDLHGLVWEWTDDYSSLLVSGDNRNQGDADVAKFCGAGALAMDDRENYALLMRVAMLLGETRARLAAAYVWSLSHAAHSTGAAAPTSATR